MRIYLLLCMFFVLLGTEETLAENVCPNRVLDLTNKSVEFCAITGLSDEKVILSGFSFYSIPKCYELCEENKCQNGSCEYRDVLEPPNLNGNSEIERNLGPCDGDGEKVRVTLGTSVPYATTCICDCPKEVELTLFEATKVINGVSVQWETASECKTSKFILWKAKPLNGMCTSDQGNYLLPVFILEVPARGGNGWGDRYPYEDGLPYVDEDGNNEFCYGLQEIEDNGKWNLYVTGVE